MVAALGKPRALWLAFACTLAPSVAVAEPFDEAPADESRAAAPQPERWYGWQTLSVDAVPAGLFVAALATDESSLTVGGAATFALGGPAVHFFHNRRLAGSGASDYGGSAGARYAHRLVVRRAQSAGANTRRAGGESAWGERSEVPFTLGPFTSTIDLKPHLAEPAFAPLLSLVKGAGAWK
jgi:hypothetical protein